MPSSLGGLAAVAQVFEEHRPRLLAMLQRRIDPALSVRLDAEDVLSEAFIEARRRWDRYQADPKIPPYPWLYGIARDCMINAYHKHHADCRSPDREIRFPDCSSLQLGFGLVNADVGPRTAAERLELQEAMRQALDRLRPADREVLWMRHFDGLAFAEMAGVLGLTENAATVRYVRALRRLKNDWRQTHGLEP